MPSRNPQTLAARLAQLEATIASGVDPASYIPELRSIFRDSLEHGLPCLRDHSLGSAAHAQEVFEVLASSVTRDMRPGPSSPLVQLLSMARKSVRCPERQHIDPPSLEMVEAEDGVRDRLRRRGRLG